MTVGDSTVDDSTALTGRQLAPLQCAWDGIYLIRAHSGGGLLVTRADGGELFPSGDPVDARDAIISDHARRPMVKLEATRALGQRLAFQRAHPEAKWWTDASGRPQEESAPTVDLLLGCLRDRGLT
jgi:hypothetical protein